MQVDINVDAIERVFYTIKRNSFSTQVDINFNAI